MRILINMINPLKKIFFLHEMLVYARFDVKFALTGGKRLAILLLKMGSFL